MNQNLCPFCFEPISGNGTCLHCGHRIGEPMRGIQLLPVGWILDGKYRIGMTLGQGGFGITYLAYDMNLQQKVAIKEYFPSGLVTRSAQTVIPSTQSGQMLYQKGVDAFYREAQLLARFQNHPNIVHIHNFFRENNTAYFVMEYVEGKSLAAYLNERGGRLSQEETISLLSPIMDALDTLHQTGILHRDIAPDNIYLTKSGQVKLLDFGAAKNELSQHTHSSAAILKPGYAPLEQYSVTGDQGPWTDVYAMGAVIYRCLTGMMPPDAPDRIIGREIIPVNAGGTGVSKNVEAAVMKALSLNIPERWQRMSDFKYALSDPDVKVTNIKQDSKRNSISGQQQKRKKKKKIILPFLITTCVIIGVAITWLIITIVIPNYKYNSAVTLMNSGNYSKASTMFINLGDYKDSQQKIKECEEKIREERFGKMIALISSENIDDTLEAFKILGNNPDQELFNKVINYEAVVLMKSDPKKAAKILEALEVDNALSVLNEIGIIDKTIRTTIISECSLRNQALFFEVGDIIKFGSYEQDNITNNGNEPIEWLILDKNHDKLFLVSKYALDNKPFYTHIKATTWETSSIRYWLNNIFILNAFTVEEQNLIQTTTVYADKNPEYDTPCGNDTEDKIFLLSINEVRKYFSSDLEREIKTTEYSKNNKAYIDRNGYTWWWLRSPGSYDYFASGVSSDGSIHYIGRNVDNNRNTVRPALWIKP